MYLEIFAQVEVGVVSAVAVPACVSGCVTDFPAGAAFRLAVTVPARCQTGHLPPTYCLAVVDAVSEMPWLIAVP